MKTRNWMRAALLSLRGWAVVLAALVLNLNLARVEGGPTTLAVRMAPVVSVQGAAGAQATLQLTAVLQRTNQWVALTNTVLGSSAFQHCDVGATQTTNGFYRATSTPSATTLGLALFPLLTVQGDPGSQAVLQWADSLGNTNQWFTLTNFALGSDPVLWCDLGATQAATRLYRALAVPSNPAPAKLAWILPGTFTMGSPTSEVERGTDELPHTVTLARSFFIGKYEVTQGEFLSLMSSNPSQFFGDPSRPVEQVTWFDATNYCANLNQQEQAAGRLPAGWRYRLPTEAEWEYACRAGTTTPFHYGPSLFSEMANFFGQREYVGGIGTVNNPGGAYLARTTAVGSYQPNAFGLYDMHGNVWEWCQDWYGSYTAGTAVDPPGPPTGTARVLRGGSWYYRATLCRSADRYSYSPTFVYSSFGFRVVLAPAP
jgi:formylglycine-generating enzyme required for sulfatase activity